jgi:hypothetical protein
MQTKWVLFAAMAGALAAYGDASAQSGPSSAASAAESQFERTRNVSVRERPRPEYSALGLRRSSVFAFPKVTTSLTYDDNIYALTENGQEDLIASVSPRVDVETRWTRHQLRGSAQVARNQFLDNSEESHTVGSILGEGRLDILRTASVGASAGYEHLVEPRTAFDSARSVDEPIRFDRATLAANGQREFNRLRLGARLGFTDYDYENGRDFLGAVVPQDYRDRLETRAEATADYAVSPDTSVFVSAAVDNRSYDQTGTLGGVVDRDSSGYELGVGADFDLSNLARGRVQVGYLTQDFDDPAAGEIQGFGIRGRVEWFPTQLTTVAFTASRRVEDSGLIRAAGYLSTSVGVQVDHELLRNVILTGRADYEMAEHQGIDRDDDRFSASFGVNYLLNRRVGVSLLYTRYDQSSGGRDRGFDFNVNRLTAALVLQY